jgi:hypothetical protein
MARRVTITFADGTTHVYEGVPDDATPDSVQARAQQDFGKSIANMDGGRPAQRQDGGKIFENPAQVSQDVPGVVNRSVPLPVAPEPQYSVGEKLLGAGETALTAVTGAVAPFIGVGAGMAENLAQGTSNRVDTPANAARFTYAPRTQAGQDYTETLGRALDVAKIPAYVPGSGQLARGIQAGKPVATATAVEAARPVVNAAKTVGGAVADTAAFPVRATKGAFMNEPYTPSSAMVPLKDTYYPQTVVDRFMKGQATLEEVQQAVQPTANLRGNPVFRMAEKIANKNTQGQSLVPLPGRTSEAFGERLMQGYTNNPLTFAADVGLPILGAPPISPIVRGAQMMADKYLASQTGFAPGFIEKLQAAQDIQQLRSQPPTLGGRPIPPTPPGPQFSAPESMIPRPGYGKPQPMPANAGPQQFVPGPVMPESIAQTRVPQVAAPASMTAEQQAMIEQIRRRGELQRQAQATMGENYTPPRDVTPIETGNFDRPRTALDDVNDQRAIDRNPALARNPIFQKKGTLSMVVSDKPQSAGSYDSPLPHKDAVQNIVMDSMASRNRSTYGSVDNMSIPATDMPQFPKQGKSNYKYNPVDGDGFIEVLDDAGTARYSIETRAWPLPDGSKSVNILEIFFGKNGDEIMSRSWVDGNMSKYRFYGKYYAGKDIPKDKITSAPSILDLIQSKE